MYVYIRFWVFPWGWTKSSLNFSYQSALDVVCITASTFGELVSTEEQSIHVTRQNTGEQSPANCFDNTKQSFLLMLLWWRERIDSQSLGKISKILFIIFRTLSY